MARAAVISLALALPASLGLAVGASAVLSTPATVITSSASSASLGFASELPMMDLPAMEVLDMELLDFEEQLQHTAANARNDSWERMLEASLHGISDSEAATDDDLTLLLGDEMHFVR